MKILVTGGVGFIGVNLIKKLVKEGHKVACLDNYSTGTKSNEIDGCEYHNYDIENITQLGGDFDMCFHLAGLSRIQPSFGNPTETFRVNLRGTEAVCEWARLNNIKVIYGGSSSKWHDPYQSPYAMYKHLGEEVCKMYRKTYNLDVNIARFYNVYGPHEIIDGPWAAVIGIWRRQIRDSEPITIVGDGNQRRDFTYVDDIAEGLIRISQYDGFHEDAWELGTGINYSMNEIYGMFKKLTGVRCVYLPEQHGNYRETLRENNDSLNKLSWSPTDKLSNYINSLF